MKSSYVYGISSSDLSSSNYSMNSDISDLSSISDSSDSSSNYSSVSSSEIKRIVNKYPTSDKSSPKVQQDQIINDKKEDEDKLNKQEDSYITQIDDYSKPKAKSKPEYDFLLYFGAFLVILCFIFVPIAFICFFIVLYVSFSELLFFTFNPLIFEWISIFSKTEIVHQIFTVFSCLSDFGYFYILFVLFWMLVKNYTTLAFTIVEYVYQKLFPSELNSNDDTESPKPTTPPSKDDNSESNSINQEQITKSSVQDSNNNKSNVESHDHYDDTDDSNCCDTNYVRPLMIILVILLIVIGFDLLIIFSLIYWKILLGFSLFFTIGIMLFASLFEFVSLCDSELISMCDEIFLDDKKVELETFLLFPVIISRDKIMFNQDLKNTKFLKYSRIIISLFIIMSQIYIIVIAAMHYNSGTSWVQAGIVIGIFIRGFFIVKIIDMNIFYCLFNIRKVFNTITHTSGKIVYVIVFIMYGIMIICVIVITILSHLYDFPYIDYLEYVDSKGIPFKIDEQNNISRKDNIKSFCYINSQRNIPFSTTDFAMLTTLPRLYKVNEYGQCYIKPKFRGVFNSTMKYIFGEDYHTTQHIHIYCYPKMHYPELVITSDEIIESFIELDSNKDFEILDNFEKEDIKSEETFQIDETFCDQTKLESCHELLTCINKNNGECREEWSLFTNNYWKLQSEEYDANLKGLEQYQITIDDDYIFQPKYYDPHDNKYYSGTHFIVGGGSEDAWGYGAIIENIARVFIPTFFGSIIPLYEYVNELYKEMYNTFTEFAYSFIYLENLSTNEMKEISSLLTHFNFSYNSLFMVGHSLSGTTFKELSYVSDIDGIVFDASIGLGYAQFRVIDSFPKTDVGTNKLSNIYCGNEFLLTGNDEDFEVNGKLPSLFFNPTVYDTACLTAVSCSEDQQYVPYCKQVLRQHDEDPLQNYQKLLDAYLNN